MDLPRRHLDLLVSDQGDRVDRPAGIRIQQPPSRHIRHPHPTEELLLHRQDARATIGHLGCRDKPTSVPWPLNLPVDVLDAHEEQLVAETEGQMLQERRVGDEFALTAAG